MCLEKDLERKKSKATFIFNKAVVFHYDMGESVHKKNRCFFQIFEPCARFIIREGNETRKDKTEGKKWEEEEGKGRENNRNRKEPNQGLAPSLLSSSLRILWKTGSHIYVHGNFHVGTIVFIEARAWATVVTPYLLKLHGLSSHK